MGKTTMTDKLRALMKSEAYSSLAARRRRMCYSLTFINIALYMAYVLSMGYARDFVAMRVGDGALNVGVVFTMFVIVFSALLSWFYVWWANSRFDPALRQLLADAGFERSPT